MIIHGVCVLALMSMISMEMILKAKLGSHWDNFKSKHKKSYSTAEETIRKQNFKNNVELILEHNLKADLGKSKHKLAVNQFSDLSNAEFRKTMLGTKMPLVRTLNSNITRSGPKINLEDLPAAVDWRKMGMVTPIKNQGNCGSCWSFAVIGALEGAWAKKTQQLVVLSEQNLVDCASQADGYSNMGCEGGFLNDAFQYIIDNKGVDLATCYPYEMSQNECMYNASCRGATMSSFEQITEGNEEDMMSAVAENGPVSVGLDAGQPEFQSYSMGVYSDEACEQQVNHAVLVVGYGSQDGQAYWLIKNSWGIGWGEQGYMRLARNAGNMCGVTNMASYPIVSK